ncbi:distal tail protein Dit [Enterococcus innesii]|uniref:distal tail protein Dit n=1 Tax=Enterococcus innesii TaxID=2839759 RepID=UPI0034A33119
MITIKFNGIDLTQYFNVLEVERELLPTRENYSVESEFRHGKAFDGYKYNSREIKVKAIILAENTIELQKVKRELAGVLDVSEPAKLSFSDEPDKYYLAVLDGTTDVSQVSGFGSVELSFVCYDPFAYSEDAAVVENKGTSSVAVEYAGTFKAFPIIEAEMTSRNSLVSFINQSGKILQFGDPALIDTQVVQQSETLLNVRKMTADLLTTGGWKENAETFPNPLMDGRMLVPSLPLEFSKGGAGVLWGERGTDRRYHGACFSRDIPADSNGHVGAKNFSGTFSTIYNTHKITNSGLNRLELRDKNGKQVVGVTFYKMTNSNNVARMYITINNTVVHTRNFQPTHWNSFTSEGKSFNITKFGSDFTITMGNVSEGGFIFNFKSTALQNTEVTKIVHFTGNWAGTENNMTNQLNAVKFIKHAVDKIVDAPTLFSEGDILKADTSTGIVYLNNLEQLNLDTLGNEWEDFFLTKGSNEITVVQSDFASIPKVKITYKERWL